MRVGVSKRARAVCSGRARLVGDGVVVVVDELLLLDDLGGQLALAHDGDARLGVRARFGARVRVRPTMEMPASHPPQS